MLAIILAILLFEEPLNELCLWDCQGRRAAVSGGLAGGVLALVVAVVMLCGHNEAHAGLTIIPTFDCFDHLPPR